MITVALQGAPAAPRSLSPTSASAWQQCELKHALTYWYGWQETSTVPQHVGNATHRAVELLYGLDPTERSRSVASELLREALVEEVGESVLELKLLAACENSLDGLFEIEDPRHITVGPEGLEIWVEADLYGAPIRGRIDRLYDASGAYVVADYKTGKTPQPVFTEKAFFGLWTYAAALAASGEGLPDRLELLYLAGRDRLVRPVLRSVAIEHARGLAAIWQEILSAYERRSVKAKRSKLCDWCAFQPVCPAFDKRSAAVGSTEFDERVSALGLRRRERRPDRGVPDVVDV